MNASRDNWVPIPGYDRYQINPYGEIMRISNAKMMTTRDKQGSCYINLWDGKKQVCRSVAKLVAQTFLPNRTEKAFVWHKNGLHFDNFVGNLEWVTQHELACRMAALNPRRKPVIKKNPTGEVVEIYDSVADASRKSHISQRAVRNRCLQEVKDPYWLDGHNYAYEK